MIRQTQIVHFVLQQTVYSLPNSDSTRKNALAPPRPDTVPTTSLSNCQAIEAASLGVSPSLKTMIQGDLGPRLTCCETHFPPPREM